MMPAGKTFGKTCCTENEKGRNLADSQQRNTKGRINQSRPKSEKFRTSASAIVNEKTSSTNLLKKNLDFYVYRLNNVELKQKLESCPGNLGDCPVLNDFRKNLKKSKSNHVNVIPKNDERLCKTSRLYSSAKTRHSDNKEEIKMTNQNSDKKRIIKEIKGTSSSTSRGIIRSTRAQELRSQSNRDLLKPKTTNEKLRTTSPYVSSLPQKKKKINANADTKAIDGKKKQTKPVKNLKEKAVDEISLQRQKTQEVLNPKVVKKVVSVVKTAAGDCGPPELKKSQTFFICKGNRNGEGDDKPKGIVSPWKSKSDVSEENGTDDDLPSPKPKPLTHNDSFCLIVKSSQNWSQKNRSDDEKWLHYGMACEEKSKKGSDKGILKNTNYDLKSVDSLEKVDSEKIVRFSDEFLRNKKVLKKLVRRKKRLQNFFTPAWYQKNKLFQKYLQILREKSVLLSDRTETPEDLKPFRVPTQVKERYEAEMFGLYPRKGRTAKSHTKDAYSY